MSQSVNVVHILSLNYRFHQPFSPALLFDNRLLHISHQRNVVFHRKRVFPGVCVDGFSLCDVLYGPARCTTCSVQEIETNVWQGGELDLHVQTLNKFPWEKLHGETVLVRFDSKILLNPVACYSKNSRRSVYTIRYLHNAGAKVLLVSNWDWNDYPHLLETSVADHLSSLLKLKVVQRNVYSASQHDTKVTEKADIFILENLTQFKEEFSNCPFFAKMISTDVGIFVNDVFSLSHKVLASTVGVARFCHTSLAGFHFQEEFNYLIQTTKATRHPYIAVIGGGNFLQKEAALLRLASKCDGLVFVGKLAFQVMHALGLSVQQRLLESNEQHSIQKVLKLIELVRNRNIPIFTPMDFLCMNDHAPQTLDIFPASEIRTGWTPVDIGPTSLKQISSLLSQCKKILWVGPMKLHKQTRNTSAASELASLIVRLSRSGCDVTVVGTAACSMVEMSGGSITCKYFGSASAVWGFLNGRTLPGVAALDRAYPFDVDWVSIFSVQTQPLVVDIGSGNGIFLLEMARRCPTFNFLGLEINEKLVKRCLWDVLRNDLHNLHFISTNATHNFRPIISSYPGKLVLVSIQCPNPDFYKEEHRWRMVQRTLVEAIIDLLAVNGKVFLQSDIKQVSTRMRDQFMLYGKDVLLIEEDGGEWIKENPFGIRSDWEQHVLDRGAPMYRLMMQKITRKQQIKESQ